MSHQTEYALAQAAERFIDADTAWIESAMAKRLPANAMEVIVRRRTALHEVAACHDASIAAMQGTRLNGATRGEAIVAAGATGDALAREIDAAIEDALQELATSVSVRIRDLEGDWSIDVGKAYVAIAAATSSVRR